MKDGAWHTVAFQCKGTDEGLPWWLSGEESACQCRRCRFDPWGWEDPLEEEMATHSSILAPEITWTEGPGEL